MDLDPKRHDGATVTLDGRVGNLQHRAGAWWFVFGHTASGSLLEKPVGPSDHIGPPPSWVDAEHSRAWFRGVFIPGVQKLQSVDAARIGRKGGRKSRRGKAKS